MGIPDFGTSELAEERLRSQEYEEAREIQQRLEALDPSISDEDHDVVLRLVRLEQTPEAEGLELDSMDLVEGMAVFEAHIDTVCSGEEPSIFSLDERDLLVGAKNWLLGSEDQEVRQMGKVIAGALVRDKIANLAKSRLPDADKLLTQVDRSLHKVYTDYVEEVQSDEGRDDDDGSGGTRVREPDNPMSPNSPIGSASVVIETEVESGDQDETKLSLVV